jgi:hypothetical protein
MEGNQMNPIVEHLGKAMLAEAKGDEEAYGMHLEMLVQWADTDTILEYQEEAIELIKKGEIK